ncbi:hypothetical protein F5J12DRAFT_790233 [Pisolithus orientalis]|uniref:uncharacterized protein n=1 Tax=Pisolithus orientalis TaxID=936130 RepID=UPI0022240799|nr:uncharacterized protein F5J12DRAFT_790233 [Pisolithus orientalis]KAI6034973.1 hypothetical protein F5J12DRAFT_790233 [Pisolithus orientalis]
MWPDDHYRAWYYWSKFITAFLPLHVLHGFLTCSVIGKSWPKRPRLQRGIGSQPAKETHRLGKLYRRDCVPTKGFGTASF